MNISAGLLSDLDACDRRGFWGRRYESQKLHPTEMLRQAIASALTDPEEQDQGQFAGNTFMGLAGDRGLDTKSHKLYDCALHHAALADLLVTHLQSRYAGRWGIPEPKVGENLTWEPSCLLRGTELHRIVLVSDWGDDRALAESRSWYTLGELAVYKLPMTMDVFVLGASRDGRRHSAWSKALLHPRNRGLRFKKQVNKVVGFKESWTPIWREDHDQISRETWLEAMERDGILEDVHKTVRIEALSPERVKEMRELIERKAEKLMRLRVVPDPNFSGCEQFGRPCPFQRCCFPELTLPEDAGGYRLRQSVDMR